ncbi:MAG TPA: D-alanyl-D-alanine carboxypeptidase/D-alanyl-D-alanine-endopeptidase [Pirellulales bacterium]|nr:D-alanyl-D-alanine carboxypeptidase/D-alanyl-D-alanine-endopeptidase [Pirellulales bacterium]
MKRPRAPKLNRQNLRLWICVWVLAASTRFARANDALAERIEAVTNGTPYQVSHWGLLFVDLGTGETVYQRDADKLFAPASVTKLFSVATALDALGADHRFETPLYARGEVDDQGRLQGDLVLVASGDLSLGGRTDREGHIAFTNNDHVYAGSGEAAEITLQDPLAGLNELARQAAAVIHHVQGDVLIDDRLFDPAEGTGSGPSRLTPIMVNDNLVDIIVTPAEPGKPAQVKWRPMTSALQVDAQVTTVATYGRTQVDVTSPTAGRIVVRGQIAAGRKPLVRIHDVPDPASFARALLIEALARAGITVEASALGTNRPDRLPPQGEYQGLRRVALLTSPPFSDSAKLVLKVSHNLHASTLPLLVAVKHGQRTLSEGLRRQHDFLARAGVDVETISFGGGAGGDSADFTTPRATVQLLKYMATRPDFAAYESALPILGGDGTLARAVPAESPARGKAQAKTGTLFWSNRMNGGEMLTSKALAGYLTTSGGRRLAFAVFVNNVHTRSSADRDRIGQTLGKICEIVHTAL